MVCKSPIPSVITLNAVAAAHAVNDFLFDFLGLRTSDAEADLPSLPFRSRPDSACHTASKSQNVGNVSIGSPWATPWSFPWWKGDVIAQTFGQSCKDEPLAKVLAPSVRGL